MSEPWWANRDDVKLALGRGDIDLDYAKRSHARAADTAKDLAPDGIQVPGQFADVYGFVRLDAPRLIAEVEELTFRCARLQVELDEVRRLKDDAQRALVAHVNGQAGQEAQA